MAALASSLWRHRSCTMSLLGIVSKQRACRGRRCVVVDTTSSWDDLVRSAPVSASDEHADHRSVDVAID